MKEREDSEKELSIEELEQAAGGLRLAKLGGSNIGRCGTVIREPRPAAQKLDGSFDPKRAQG